MKPADIVRFLEREVEPLTDRFAGKRYRAAAHLKDGTYLPCVVFESKQQRLELALLRFEEELRSKPASYRLVVESFVCSGSHVWDIHIQDVELSPFAWPLEILRTIHGETTMGLTAFVAEMKDGAMFGYGTNFNFEFFDLPQRYSYSDIVRIHSGKVYSQDRGIEAFSLEGFEQSHAYRDRPFFTCYLNEIPKV